MNPLVSCPTCGYITEPGHVCPPLTVQHVRCRGCSRFLGVLRGSERDMTWFECEPCNRAWRAFVSEGDVRMVEQRPDKHVTSRRAMMKGERE